MYTIKQKIVPETIEKVFFYLLRFTHSEDYQVPLKLKPMSMISGSLLIELVDGTEPAGISIPAETYKPQSR